MPDPASPGRRIKAVAIMMARNAAGTLQRLLAHMHTHGIPVIMIDHGSTDATRAIGAEHLGGAVLELFDEPYRGVFDLGRQLELKREIIDRLDVEWIVNLDADEFLMPPGSESLLAFLDRHAADAGEAVDCDEYTFLPASEADVHTRKTFVETMTGYVHLQTRDPKQRVFRRQAGLDRWMRTGGHSVSSLTLPERLQLHHYIGLSLDQLRAQYLGLVRSPHDVTKGWHYNRTAPGPDFIVAPAPGELLDRRRDGLRPDRVVHRLPIFRRRAGVRPPVSLPAGTDLVVAGELPTAVAEVTSAVAATAPGLRVARLQQAAHGLPKSVALLQVIADGRRGLVAGRSGQRHAAAWVHFVAATREEGLRIARYGEIRIEDLEAGEVDLAPVLDDVLSSGPRHDLVAHPTSRPAPAGLPLEEVRAFEALAGALLRDLGYVPTTS